jgi:hypothetical protein
MPSFDTSYKPRLLRTNKTPWKNPYTEIKEEKASLISVDSFL